MLEVQARLERMEATLVGLSGLAGRIENLETHVDDNWRILHGGDGQEGLVRELVRMQENLKLLQKIVYGLMSTCLAALVVEFLHVVFVKK